MAFGKPKWVKRETRKAVVRNRRAPSSGSPSTPYARPRTYNPAPKGPRPVSKPRRTTPTQGRKIEKRAKVQIRKQHQQAKRREQREARQKLKTLGTRTPLQEFKRDRDEASRRAVRLYFKNPGATRLKLGADGDVDKPSLRKIAKDIGTTPGQGFQIIGQGKEALPKREKEVLRKAAPVQRAKIRESKTSYTRKRFAGATVRAGTTQQMKDARGKKLSRFVKQDTLVGASAPAVARLAYLSVNTPVQVGRATVEDPGKVIPATAKGVKDMLVGLPGAAYQSITNPTAIPGQMKKDWARRYGPLVEGDNKKFRERLKKEGAAAEILDLAAAGAIEGRVLATGLKSTKAGKVYMTKPRPKLRTTGGPAKEQKLSGNAIVVGAQRAQDARRRHKTKTRVKRADEAGTPTAALDRMVKPDEVVPLRRKKVLGNREVAARKSRGVQAQKQEQGREVHKEARRNLARLSKDEDRAFKYAMQLGLPADPKRAKELLERRRAQIVATREVEGTKIPAVRHKTNDELLVIDQLLEAPEKAFTQKLRDVADTERRRNRRTGRGDPGLAGQQQALRAYAPVAEMLKMERRGDEAPMSFVKRVAREAKKEGLAPPAYFKSQKRPEGAFAAFALGGTKAVAKDKTYEGKLFRTGREDTRSAIHLTSLAGNIKRKHNWNAVADNFDAHTFKELGEGTISQVKDRLDEAGIDPSTVAFWNPKRYREARRTFEREGDDPVAIGDDPSPEGLHGAVSEAAVDYKGLSTKPEDFRETKGWSVIPKDVYDEIHADTKPSSAVGRSWDVLKGKQSRLLLGTNPPWLAFQAGSNVLLTALAKTGPIDAVKAQVWWKRLDDDTKAAVEPYVGVSSSHVDVQQTKLGATADNKIVNAYRGFKESPFWHANLKIPGVTKRTGRQGPSISGLNPLDVLFRADSAQNNFFRRAVLYSQVKRDAYKRMGENVSGAQKMQDRLHGLVTLGPEAQIRAVLHNRKALEQHADYTNRMLGDYTTYTAKERRILGRGIMFYGFLRFSLEFAFRTMPVKHPIMTDLIGNLGRLQTEEVRELLGGDELPFALGRVYIRKDGKLQVVDLTRLNPAANTLVTATSDPRWTAKLLASLPPMVTTAMDAAYQKEAFTGKTMKVEGQSGYAARERESTGEGLGNTNLARFTASRVLKLAFPYRVWEGVAFKGQPQGSDALAFDPRPTKWKRLDPEFAKSLKAEKSRVKDLGAAGVIKEELFPFLPHSTRDPEIAASIRERRNPKKKSESSGSLIDQPTRKKSLLDENKSSKSLLD